MPWAVLAGPFGAKCDRPGGFLNEHVTSQSQPVNESTSPTSKPVNQQTNKPVSLEENRSLIALSMMPGVGPGRIRALIAEFGSAEAVLDASKKALARVPGIGEQTLKAILKFDDFAKVDQQLVWAERAEASLLPYWDDRFPELLESIFDPPVFLWTRGVSDWWSRRMLAVVGTRRPSPYGERVTAELVAQLVESGLVIVSGLAYGIDAIAHREALRADGQTVAVLGSGIDRIYPSRHADLARQIVMEGALVSEFPLRTKPDAVNFPRRNRIISGLAIGTLVVEAFEKGGALITARLAIEHNRDVFAVPGSIYTPSAAGCHRLIRRGEARLVQSAEDILEEIGLSSNGSTVASGTLEAVQSLAGIEKRLYETLTDEPMLIDSLCEKTGLDVSTALVYLLNLEFKGLVYQMAGKQFYRV